MSGRPRTVCRKTRPRAWCRRPTGICGLAPSTGWRASTGWRSRSSAQRTLPGCPGPRCWRCTWTGWAGSGPEAPAGSRGSIDPNASLQISDEGNGKLFLDMVSLMPDKTWKNHGLRTDLAEALDAIHPKFLRFPGGCWVEGNEMKQMNHWKNTIGNIDTRTPLWNFWGYNATNGLGYHEYLQLAEDLGAEPLYCINIGMSHREVIDLVRRPLSNHLAAVQEVDVIDDQQ